MSGRPSMPIGAGTFEIFAKYAWVDDIETNLLNTPLGRVEATEDVTASIGYYAEHWAISAYGRSASTGLSRNTSAVM